MLASEISARCALRRQVLHRRPKHEDLLPSNLSRPNVQRDQYTLFSDCRGGRRGRFSPLLTVPARMFARSTGLGRDAKYGFPSAAADRRKWPRKRGRRTARGTARSRLTASSATVSSPSGGHSKCRSAYVAPAFCQEAHRRDAAAHGPDRNRCRVWLCATIQCCDPQGVPPDTHTDSATDACRPTLGAK